MIANKREINTEAERKRLLIKTGLMNQLAAWNINESIFLASHGPTDSVLAIRHKGELTVWEVLGFRESRERMAAEIRGALETTLPADHRCKKNKN